MRRQSSTLGDLIGRMARDENNWAMGQIRWAPCGYHFSDEGYTNPQGVFFKPFDVDGRMVSLRSRRTVTNCPLQMGDFPKIREGYQTPKSICDKCAHHLPKSRCVELRKLRQTHNPGSTTLGVVAEVLSQAKKVFSSETDTLGKCDQ